MNNTDTPLPVVFACAGASGAGQLAYKVALELDRRGVAEMSCLAGLAAGKRPFLKKIKNRPLWIIDGCPIECANGIMEEVWHDDIHHICLHDFGVRKTDAPPEGDAFEALISDLVCSVANTEEAVQDN